jgi:phosphoribosylformimino-5-aminoimidazole carboxamide ribotide isomerase
MIILPAIDIIEGNVVRLTRGEYESAKKYVLTPMQAAESFYNDGARNMHVVDLDGAKSGKADNAKTIEALVKKFDMSIEVGGGIRTFDQIESYLNSGVKKVILGTIAVKDWDFTERAVAKYKDKIAVGVDAINCKIAINGWQNVTDKNSLDFCKKLKLIGVDNVIYTDISCDGTLNGTNLEIYRVLCQTYYPKITASGGISSVAELKELKKIGAYGAILGQALYENKLNLKEVMSSFE